MTSSSCFICFSRTLAVLCALAPAVAVADGRVDYDRFCAPCHGSAGDGRGPVAHLLAVPPRDFTTGTFKFRSTPSGTPPRDEDLLRVIDDGLPGTPMPGWRTILPEPRRRALVAVIEGFSTRFGQPADAQPMPAVASLDAVRGRAVYERMKCGECHGDGGAGNGPAAATLVDDRGRPMKIPDLRRGESLRLQSEGEIVRAILTGLDGTPMPSYAGVVADSEVWDLARYVFGLRHFVGRMRGFLQDGPLVWRRP